MGPGKKLEAYIEEKQKAGELNHAQKELLLGYSHDARKRWTTKQINISSFDPVADFTTWIRSQKSKEQDKKAVEKFEQDKKTAEKLGIEFFKTHNLGIFMAGEEENKEGGVGGFLKKNGGWVVGGIAALASFFFGGGFEGGFSLTTLIVGVGAFFLADAFKDKIGSFVGGILGENKKPDPNAPGQNLEQDGAGEAADKAKAAAEANKTAAQKAVDDNMKRIQTKIEQLSPPMSSQGHLEATELKAAIDKDSNSKITRQEVETFMKELADKGVTFSPENVDAVTAQLTNKGVKVEPATQPQK